MNPIYVRRRRVDIVVKVLCLAAAIFGVTWLAPYPVHAVL